MNIYREDSKEPKRPKPNEPSGPLDRSGRIAIFETIKDNLGAQRMRELPLFLRDTNKLQEL